MNSAISGHWQRDQLTLKNILLSTVMTGLEGTVFGGGLSYFSGRGQEKQYGVMLNFGATFFQTGVPLAEKVL